MIWKRVKTTVREVKEKNNDAGVKTSLSYHLLSTKQTLVAFSPTLPIGEHP